MKLPALTVMFLVAATGCGHGRTTDPPAASRTGPPVSSYPVPASKPRGVLHVVSLGSEPLYSDPEHLQRYLHLRLAAVNSSDDFTWTLDPNEQLLVDGATTMTPAFAETSQVGNAIPVLSLARGTRGHLDLFYRMPTAAGPGQVKLSWKLRRGSELAAQVTELEPVADRLTAHTYYRPASNGHVAGGWGPDAWWWSDYYFWNRGPCWWGYPRAQFHRHYPRHPGFAVAHPVRVDSRTPASAPPSGRGASVGGGRSSGGDTSDWRGAPSVSSAPEPRQTETSSWRNSPPPSHDSSSSSSSFSSSSSSSNSGSGSSSPPPPPPSSSGGGDSGGGSRDSSGKSGWRGGN